jgi:hypothetical protein
MAGFVNDNFKILYVSLLNNVRQKYLSSSNTYFYDLCRHRYLLKHDTDSNMKKCFFEAVKCIGIIPLTIILK